MDPRPESHRGRVVALAVSGGDVGSLDLGPNGEPMLFDLRVTRRDYK